MSGWFIFMVSALTLGGLYAAFALIVNVEGGWAGLWDLGIAGLLGVGGYVYVITTIASDRYSDLAFTPGWPMWSGILLAGVATGCVAFIIGAPSLRLRGEYFLITTFAFAEVIRQLIVIQSSLTNGVVGLSRVDRPFDDLVSGREYRYVLLGIVALLVLMLYLLTRRLGRSPFGRLLRASRENEVMAGALGKHVTRYRLQVFVLAGVLIGICAPVYVWYIRSIAPGVFTADITFTVWTALVIGGLGSFSGPALGAIVLIVGTEALLLIQVSAEHATTLAATRPFILGVALIIFLRYHSEGIVPERRAFRRSSRMIERTTGSQGDAAASLRRDEAR